VVANAVSSSHLTHKTHQGIVAVLLGVFLAIAVVAMFTTARVVTRLSWIGMIVSSLPPEEARARGLRLDRGGLLVREADGIAGRAGVRDWDVLLAINGTPIWSLEDFSRVTGKTNLLDGVTLDLVQGQTPVTLAIPAQVPVVLGGTPGVPGKTPATPGKTPARTAQAAAVPAQPAAAAGIGPKWLGVEAETFMAGEGRELGIPAGVKGVLIDGVATNSRAEKAGLLPNDVIDSVNGQDIQIAADLWRILDSLSLATPLEFRLYRNRRFMSVVLPGDPGARAGGLSPALPGRGLGGGQCLVCTGCGATAAPPAGAACRGLRCPNCGGQMIPR